MDNYTKTPSFYNDEDTFMKYLGQTSYYISLQNSISKIIKLLNPSSVLELGSGTGATSIRLAKENPYINFESVDMREDMIKISNENLKKESLSNLNFIENDMIEYTETLKRIPKFTFMLYSFHHIEDPLEKKITFLRNFKEKMISGDMLCICETFIPEGINEMDLKILSQKMWLYRDLEGYASTFWNSLKSLSKEDIAFSKQVANFSYDYENKAGKNVIDRNEEYLISMKWLSDIAIDIGYDILISEPINNCGDGLVLLTI
jgi:SAM-dependent methyltransferase